MTPHAQTPRQDRTGGKWTAVSQDGDTTYISPSGDQYTDPELVEELQEERLCAR